ncbi:MAG: SDR family oxidoreductase [Chloroflexi bacterium]|nr:SDR family oxidoreductase [Chloroflexota bacterium]
MSDTAHHALDQFKLDGRVVIVTGGAGLLGEQYVWALAQAGAHAVAADLDCTRAEQLADAVSAQTGVKALGIQVDVADPASVSNLMQATLATFGRVDGLVNNAAIDPKFDSTSSAQHTATFENYPLTLWNQSLAVNVTGMFLCAQAVAPTMLAQKSGVIVNVASTYGIVGPDQRLYERDDPGSPRTFKPVAYSVTKSAILGLTRYLAAYWAEQGIRVNTLTPGGVFNDHDDEFVRRYSARTILGRMAEKSEYTGALLFLLSDASSYMTGSNLIVDGGWTAW